MAEQNGYDEDLIRSDHDLLIAIHTKLGILLTNFDEHKDSANERLTLLSETKADKRVTDDHEIRIRRGEKYAGIVIGGLAVLQIMIGIIS